MNLIKSLLPIGLLFLGQFTGAQEYNEFGQSTEVQSDKPDMSATAMLKRGEKAWVGNLCKQLSDSGQFFVIDLDIAKSDKGCPRLRDYSKVEEAYRQRDISISDSLYGTRRSTGIPPHPPGTICYTNEGGANVWSWADVPGRPGAKCARKTPYGYMYGILN